MAQHDFIFRPETETRTPAEQRALDRAAYRRQIEYLFAASPFTDGKPAGLAPFDPA